MKVNDRAAKNIAAKASQLHAKDLEKNLTSKDIQGGTQTKETIGSSQVQMSPEAQSLHKAKALASTDTIDEAKVARLQKLIDEGNYKIDAKAVADRLVDEHLATGD